MRGLARSHTCLWMSAPSDEQARHRLKIIVIDEADRMLSCEWYVWSHPSPPKQALTSSDANEDPEYAY
jgi:hypothetical protein